MRFLRHFNLDVSYYNTKTYNQTFDPQISVSSKYSTLYVHRPVRCVTGVSNWRSDTATSGENSPGRRTSPSSNRKPHPRTGRQLPPPRNRTDHDQGSARHRRSGTGPVHSQEGRLAGRPLLDRRSENATATEISTPLPTVRSKSSTTSTTSNSARSSPKPTWPGATTSAGGNFNFGFMLSARLGGVVFSRTQAALDYYGVSEATADARDLGYVEINGGDRISPFVWYDTVAKGDGVPSITPIRPRTSGSRRLRSDTPSRRKNSETCVKSPSARGTQPLDDLLPGPV